MYVYIISLSEFHVDTHILAVEERSHTQNDRAREVLLFTPKLANSIATKTISNDDMKKQQNNTQLSHSRRIVPLHQCVVVGLCCLCVKSDDEECVVEIVCVGESVVGLFGSST